MLYTHILFVVSLEILTTDLVQRVFLGKHHLKDELSKLVLVFLELAF